MTMATALDRQLAAGGTGTSGAAGGVFSRMELFRQGLTRGQVTYGVRKGRVVKAAGKALIQPAGDLTIPRWAKAASLTWPDGVVWGCSALKLHLPNAPIPNRDRLQVAVPVARRHQTNLQALKIKVPKDEQTIAFGEVRVQTLDAAIVDALRYLPEDQADPLLSWLISRRIVDPRTFRRIANRRRGYRGARRLHWYKDMVESNAASLAELDCHLLIRQSLGLPDQAWRANAPIRLVNRELVSVDVLVEGLRKVVEVDGARYHRDPNKDHERDRLLGQTGFEVLRLDAVTVMFDKVRAIKLLHQYLFPDRALLAEPGEPGGPQLPKAPAWQRYCRQRREKTIQPARRRRRPRD
ncbi:MAG: DUF559 domain-containing protein [Micrococcales bacterium]|nr:DUF559 domain-containing protein [Micrococcales bacterium]